MANVARMFHARGGSVFEEEASKQAGLCKKAKPDPNRDHITGREIQ
jgi:hypothetical protein